MKEWESGDEGTGIHRRSRGHGAGAARQGRARPRAGLDARAGGGVLLPPRRDGRRPPRRQVGPAGGRDADRRVRPCGSIGPHGASGRRPARRRVGGRRTRRGRQTGRAALPPRVHRGNGDARRRPARTLSRHGRHRRRPADAGAAPPHRRRHVGPRPRRPFAAGLRRRPRPVHGARRPQGLPRGSRRAPRPPRRGLGPARPLDVVPRPHAVRLGKRPARKGAGDVRGNLLPAARSPARHHPAGGDDPHGRDAPDPMPARLPRTPDRRRHDLRGPRAARRALRTVPPAARPLGRLHAAGRGRPVRSGPPSLRDAAFAF